MITWEYIAGYFDGEGCLLLGVVQDKRPYPSLVDRWNFSPQIHLASYDHKLLKEMSIFLTEKGIKNHILIKKKRGRQAEDCSRLYLCGNKNISKFIDNLYEFSYVKKEQFSLYRKIVEIMNKRPLTVHKGFYWTKETFLQVIKLITEINSLKKGLRGKNWYEYFSQLWEMKI